MFVWIILGIMAIGLAMGSAMSFPAPASKHPNVSRPAPKRALPPASPPVASRAGDRARPRT